MGLDVSVMVVGVEMEAAMEMAMEMARETGYNGNLINMREHASERQLHDPLNVPAEVWTEIDRTGNGVTHANQCPQNHHTPIIAYI